MAKHIWCFDGSSNRRNVPRVWCFDGSGNRRKIVRIWGFDGSGNRRLIFDGATNNPNFQLNAGAANSNRIGYTDGGSSGSTVPSPVNVVPIDNTYPGSLFNCWTYQDATQGLILTYSCTGTLAPANSFTTMQVWNSAGTTLLATLSAASASYTVNFQFAQWAWTTSFKFASGSVYQIKFL